VEEALAVVVVELCELAEAFCEAVVGDVQRPAGDVLDR
jgi:hypothetical protein